MNTTETETFAAITFQHAIPEQRVKDLMCLRMGGWEQLLVYPQGHPPDAGRRCLAYRHRAERRETTGDGTFYRWEIPFLPDAALELEVDGETETYTLTREKLIAGLQVMASKYPRHFADVLNENDDAGTGDVFLQCCLFGEIIFG